MFGSVAREQEGVVGDFDFLIDVEPKRTLLDVIGLSQDLEELLGKRVDIVTEGGVSPYLRESIF